MRKVIQNGQLVIGLVSLLSFNAMATHSDNNQDNLSVDCSISFQNKINVSPDHIIIIQDDSTLYDIYKDEMIFYKGEKIELSSEQKNQIKDFSKRVRAIGPDVSIIALEAVDLAIDALTAAFSSFDNDEEVDSVLSDLRVQLTSKIENEKFQYSYAEGEFKMDVLDSEFDKTIEEAVEKIIPSLMGSIFKAIGSAMVDGGSSLEELENIGEKVEREVEARSTALEAKANMLCDDIKTIDKVESSLSSSHPSLSDLDVIRLTAEKH